MKPKKKPNSQAFANKSSKEAKCIAPSLKIASASKDSIPNADIDTIFKNRWHGAVNIRGIRFQILYSLLRAFELYEEAEGERYIRLEGIEDVDLIGFFSKNEYVQVKTADTPWNWAKLKEPIKNFLEISRINKGDQFTLVVNFTPITDIEKLYRLVDNCEKLSVKEREDITKKFYTLCNKVGGNIEESNDLLHRLRIIPIPEQQIWGQLELKVLEAFSLGGQGISTYLSVLIARFLDWAKERKTIGRGDLENIRVEVSEALSREQGFEAYGLGYVERVLWQEDSTPNDFLEGKGTRAGHIIAELDIPRTTWLDRIDQVFTTCKVCILKASSGQGKSTLLYRYAAERWQKDNVFAIRTVELPEQVTQICDYLKIRIDLGLPILVLIDGISSQTRLWATVVRECSAMGIHVLISVRDEDWYRFGNSSSVSYEIIKPILSLLEARQIFQFLKSRNRVNNSVTSAEWAYERVGKSHLLMEYVYLLTQGRMLEERLREQIMQFSQYQENTSKIEILRRVLLADSLGTPLLLSKFFDNLNIDGDRQQILLSLEGEYLKIQDEKLIGLHWIRSACLTRILHEVYPNPAITTLSVLNAVPHENLSNFIASAICMEGFDMDEFISELANQAEDVDIETLILYLEGIFEAGERNFFAANKDLFDEAYNTIGTVGPFFLRTEFSPIIKVTLISDMVRDFGDRAEKFKILRDISLKAVKVSRGLDLCKLFLNKVSSTLNLDQLKVNIKHTGRLLDWLFLCQVNLSSWDLLKKDITNPDLLFDSSLEEFCSFMQGLARYDQTFYQQWINIHRNNAIEFLRGKTNTLKSEVSLEKLAIEFIVDSEEESPIEQSMRRLNCFHSVFPYCDAYQSQGIWLLPFGLIPSVDDTQKNISKGNFHFESDISKNAAWARISFREYLPASCFDFEKAWYEFRSYALELVQNLSKVLKKILTGGQEDGSAIFAKNLLPRLENSIKFLPSSSLEDIESVLGNVPQELGNMLKDNLIGKWSSSFSNFFFQLYEYIVNEDLSIGKLAIHNLKDASKHLIKMQKTFAQIFQEAPDYFEMIHLNSQEIRYYPILCDLIEVWIIERPRILPLDIMEYIKSQKESNWLDTLQKVKNSLNVLSSNIDFIFPSGIYIDHPLRYLPVAFSVVDPCDFEREFLLILSALKQVKHITEYFCLVPTFQGNLFLKQGFQISSYSISTLETGELLSWEALQIQELPPQIWEYLPKLEFEENPKYLFKYSVDTLISGLDQLLLNVQKIQPLSKSDDPYIISFYNKQQNKVFVYIDNLKDLASIALHLLEEYFQSYPNNQEYNVVYEFIQGVNQNVLSTAFDNFLTGDNSHFKQVNNAVKELVKIRTDLY